MRSSLLVWWLFRFQALFPAGLLPFTFQCPHLATPSILSQVFSYIQGERWGECVYSILTELPFSLLFFEGLAHLKNYKSCLFRLFYLILKEAITHTFIDQATEAEKGLVICHICTGYKSHGQDMALNLCDSNVYLIKVVSRCQLRKYRFYKIQTEHHQATLSKKQM